MKTPMTVLETSAAQVAGGYQALAGRKLDVPGLLAFWKKNKYPLLALNQGNGSADLFSSADFQSAYNEETTVHASLKAEYHAVREKWAQAGIRSLLIKSGANFPSFPYTSDNLDVLINRENEAAAKAILREMGYIELKNIEEPKKFLFRKFVEGKSVSAIHLHTQVGWLVGFMDDEAVWQKSRPAPDDASITVPSPEDVILINLAHSFYENKKFRLSDIEKMRRWWGRDDLDWPYMEKVAAQRGWLDGMYFGLLICAHIEETIWGETSIPAAAREKWEKSLRRLPLINRYYHKARRRSPVTLPFDFPFLFSKYLYYKKVMQDRDISFLWKLRDAIHTLIIGLKVRTRIRPQPSFLVTFSGPDGSGKTIHAETLGSTLDTCEITVKYYWNRTAASGLTRFSSRIIKKFKQSTPEEEGKTGAPGREKRLRNPFLRFFWSYLAAADMVWSYFLKVRIPLFLGKVVVCDRYIFDAATEIDGSLPPSDRINRLAIRLMLALSPKPDVAYLLDIPEEECAQRKTDNTDLVYLRRQRKLYLALAQRYGMKVKRTDRDFRQIVDEITKEILTSYYHDYGTNIRGLFLSNPCQLNKPRKGKQI